MMKKVLAILLLSICAFEASAQAPYPAPRSLGAVETYGRHIQRTMRLLATSTPQRHNTVRILFYGQSITEQTWSKLVSADLRRRFPHADLLIENRAIGGHSSPRLVKTMEADVFPFYPDLVIFHVYGDDGDYERIIRAIRERTTAEIMIQTDHLRRDDDPHNEETDPAKITRGKAQWNSWMNYVFLPRLAQQYGAELINQRELWKAYVRDHQLKPGDLLKDNVHLNEHGNYLMAEIIKAYLRFDPKLKSAADTGTVTTLPVNQDARWRDGALALPFDGNRLDVLVKAGARFSVRIDGRRPSEIPALRVFNRVTHYPQSTWPMLLRVQIGETPLLLETWTLTLTELGEGYRQVRFKLTGSQTGEDGAGISTERFVSQSGRVVIEPGDWNLEYCLQVFKRPLSVGQQIEWQVVPQFVDDIKANSTGFITLAQGLTNGRHMLELSGARKPPAVSLRIYRPAKK